MVIYKQFGKQDLESICMIIILFLIVIRGVIVDILKIDFGRCRRKRIIRVSGY